MTRNLKAIGAVVLAACAVGVVFASAAQAAPDGAFTAGQTSPLTHTFTVLHGEQTTTAPDVFKTGKTKIECTDKDTTFKLDEGDATKNGTATSLTVSPDYRDCLTDGKLPTTFKTSFCDYTLDQPEEVAGPDTTWKGTLGLTCSALETIDIQIYAAGTVTAHSVLVCTITVFQKKGMSDVLYHNIDANKDYILATVTLSGIEYEEHGMACPDGNGVKNTNGAYESTIKITGKSNQEDPDDVWISTVDANTP